MSHKVKFISCHAANFIHVHLSACRRVYRGFSFIFNFYFIIIAIGASVHECVCFPTVNDVKKTTKKQKVNKVNNYYKNPFQGSWKWGLNGHGAVLLVNCDCERTYWKKPDTEEIFVSKVSGWTFQFLIHCRFFFSRSNISLSQNHC